MNDDVETAVGYFRDDEPGDLPTPEDEAAPPIDGTETEALGKADWHLRKLGRVRRLIAVHDAVYAAEMARLRLRYETRRDRLQARAAWHEAPLRSYALMRREVDDVATLELPNGTIRTTLRKVPKVTVVDEAATTEWAASSLPDVLVEVAPRIDKRALTAYVTISGEVPPGVTVTPPVASCSITTEDGDR